MFVRDLDLEVESNVNVLVFQISAQEDPVAIIPDPNVQPPEVGDTFSIQGRTARISNADESEITDEENIGKYKVVDRHIDYNIISVIEDGEDSDPDRSQLMTEYTLTVEEV